MAAEPSRGSALRRARAWIGLMLGIVTLALAVRGIGLGEVRAALAGIKLPFLLLALGATVLTPLTKAARWRALFYPRAVSAGVGSLAGLVVIAQAVNFWVPGRWGEFLRAYMGGEETGTEKPFVLGTIAAEKLLDLVMLAVLLAALAPLLVLPEELTLKFGPVLVVAISASLAAALLVLGRRLWPRLAMKVLERLPAVRAERWQARLQSLMDGVSVLGASGAAPAVWGWTLVSWFVAALTNWFLLIALGLPASWLMAVFLLVVLQGGVAVPSTPGKIGVFQYLCVIALSVFGVSAAESFSYGVVLYALVVGTMGIWAALALWQRSWSLQHLRDASTDMARAVKQQI